MSFWFLLQILLNLLLAAGVAALWVRLQRPAKDDPRLSKGLQLLQSKIAVLEDLSDRTETQVNQLTALIEQKVKDIQFKIQAADKQIVKIEQSMNKSLEVAKIFQDRIPHHEIVERQNTIKYVKAARLAHRGFSVDEIADQVDLSRGEIEFIANVNREQLMFCEDSLPDWANEEVVAEPSSSIDAFVPAPLKEASKDMSSAFEIPNTDKENLRKLGDAFKAACQEADQKAAEANELQNNISTLFSVTQNMAQTFLSDKPKSINPKSVQSAVTQKPVNSNREAIVRPVQFPRLDSGNEG